MDIKALNAIKFEMKNLADKVNIYNQKSDYIYPGTYKSWINQYNKLVKKYNAITELNLENLTFDDYDLSSTGKTVREATVEHFLKTIHDLCIKIDEDIETNKANIAQSSIPAFQMRRCFKIGVRGCPKSPSYKSNRVFIAMPFDNAYLDSYQYGIVPALEGAGYEYYRADSEITNQDIMCKICSEIQSCGLVIINISGLNPNVMLEQGLAYGLGKSVIIVKDKSTTAISDLGSIEYIEYSHAGELQQKLFTALQNIH